jgi:GST-like protein
MGCGKRSLARKPGSSGHRHHERRFLAGDTYTIADMAAWPWYGALVLGRLYDAAEFLDAQSYQNVRRWTDEIDARPAARRARMVNRTWGKPSEQLRERHDKSDFELKTQDTIGHRR